MKIGELLGVGNSARAYEWGKNEVVKIFRDPEPARSEAQNAELLSNRKIRSPRYTGLVAQ